MKDPTGSTQDREVRNNNRRRYQSSYNSRHDQHSSNSQRSRGDQRGRRDRQDTRRNEPPVQETRQYDPTTPWMRNVPLSGNYTSTEHRLHHEMLAFAEYCTPTQSEKNAVETIKSNIRQVVDGRFRRATVHVFGSFSTGLSLPSSDIDIAVDVPNLPDDAVKSCLFQISTRIRNSGVAESTFVNHRARAPIISVKANEAYGSFDIDVGINNPVGVEAIEVVKQYLAKMPALRPLVLVMKGFLAQRQMNDPAKAGLGSYPLIIMAIFFLKYNPYNLNLNELTGAENLGLLLMNFLKYYGMEFPYTTSYIAIVSERAELKEKDSDSEGLSVRCLLHPENEVAKSVSKFKNFADAFKEAYARLLQTAAQEANGEKSILRKVVTFDAEVLRRREMLDANFGSQPSSNTFHQYGQPPAGGSLLSRIGGYAPPQPSYYQYQQQQQSFGYGGGGSYYPNNGHWGHDGYYNQYSGYYHNGRY